MHTEYGYYELVLWVEYAYNIRARNLLLGFLLVFMGLVFQPSQALSKKSEVVLCAALTLTYIWQVIGVRKGVNNVKATSKILYLMLQADS